MVAAQFDLFVAIICSGKWGGGGGGLDRGFTILSKNLGFKR